jgi:hypothetical protein
MSRRVEIQLLFLVGILGGTRLSTEKMIEWIICKDCVVLFHTCNLFSFCVFLFDVYTETFIKS